MYPARCLLFCLIFGIVLLCGCSAPDTTGSVSPAASPSGTTAASVSTATSAGGDMFTLTIDGVPAGSVLPQEYTCTGSSKTPGISWTNVPEGTESLVFILDDPDAPSGTFTHWILYNIPTSSTAIGQDQANGKTLSDGTQVGTNSAGSRGYYPPCPPVGTTHRYIFRLYAVDMAISQPTADRGSIGWALDGHTLGEAEVTTTFTR